MNTFLQIFLSILVVIAILGVLISLHEAGHLAMAKLFNVYCFEYSIGFGPAFVHVKKEGAETYFSLRAIPLGGYVSMFGEAESIPQGMDAPPPERSLEGIKKWKKATILSAGVIVNFTLGLILLFISRSCFPVYYASYRSPSTSQVETVWIQPSFGGEYWDRIEAHNEPGYQSKDYVISFPYNFSASTFPLGVGYVADSNVRLFHADGTISDEIYLAVYAPSTLVEDTDFTLTLWPADTNPERVVPQELKAMGVEYLPADAPLTVAPEKAFGDGSYILFNPTVVPGDLENYDRMLTEKDGSGDFVHHVDFGIESIVLPDSSVETGIRMTLQNQKFLTKDIYVHKIEYWLGWENSWKEWARMVPDACTMIVKGFISLFTEGIGNLSGIVGMTAAVPSIAAAGGAANIFFYAAVISINLAFFNLLPFPGLDGWQLLVTGIEAITKKKVPMKAKAIVSYIGLGLLILLALAVTIKDIMMLF